MGRGAVGSLGDAVGNVHGGKYQFNVGGGERRAGEDFATALAATSATGGGGGGGGEGEEPLPRWARTLVPQAEYTGTLRFTRDESCQEVRVSNRWRTWEPFVAAVVPLGGDAAHPAAALAASFALRTTRGTLAPRGGANNACDPSKPYRDSAVIGVAWEGAHVPEGEAVLVVKTEEEQWTYRLLIEQ